MPHAQVVLRVREHLLDGRSDGPVAVREDGLGLQAPQLPLQELKDPRVRGDVLVADEGLSQHDRLVVPIDADDVKVEQAEAICRVRVVADEHVLKTLERF